jgi:hypothetical protein
MLILIQGVSFSAENRAALSLKRDGLEWRGKVEWHKKIVDGADSLFSYYADTVAFNASVRDTIVSCAYYTKERNNSVAFNIYGGATTRIQIEIQGANLGNYVDYPNFSNLSAIPDSVYKTIEWIVTGTGVNGDKISVSQDSIQANKRTLPIELHLDGIQVFRILTFCSVDQVGNTRISGDIWQKED